MRSTLSGVPIASPDGRTLLRVGLADSVRKFSADRGCAFYSIERDGRTVVADSRLGLDLDGLPALAARFEEIGRETLQHEGCWSACYGSRSTVRDDHRRMTVWLRERDAPHRSLWIEFRVYDRGVAFRYLLPEVTGRETFTLIGESTEFRFGESAVGYQQRWTEDEYRPLPLSQLDKQTERPLLVQLPGGGFACVTEAGTDDFSRMRVAPDQWQKDVLRPVYDGAVHLRAPATTPWRVIGLADRAVDLIGMDDLVLSLSEPCAVEDTRWIRPGKAIREVTLSTRGGKACVDFAAKHGLQYVLYDAGWYGHEYDDLADPRRVNPDPDRTRHVPEYAGLDLHEVIRHGRSKDVGVLLYVNRRALERHWREIIPLYASWGVAGMKFGFVTVGPQGWTKWLHDAVRLCAEHRLLVDIHDAYRPSGFSRTYPNLLTQEGTRGNEHFPTATHNVTLPFTRFVAGPADYTICYRHAALKTLDAHQLAMAVVYYSPLQLIYWYSRPDEVEGVEGLDFFRDVPTAWDDTVALAGEVGRHVVIARRRGADWFVGAMAGDEAVELSVPLSFLQDGRFRMTRYADRPDARPGPASVERDVSTVSAMDVLPLRIPAAGGTAIRLQPIEGGTP